MFEARIDFNAPEAGGRVVHSDKMSLIGFEAIVRTENEVNQLVQKHEESRMKANLKEAEKQKPAL